jgi:protein-S-isoprenylcysteine O-methyltransferase Ste14
VRHPGYAGALLTYWGTPIFLGSLLMFIPVMFITVFLVVRTNLEDNTLQEKLDGYREYAGRVRYRLLPGVW